LAIRVGAGDFRFMFVRPQFHGDKPNQANRTGQSCAESQLLTDKRASRGLASQNDIVMERYPSEDKTE